jgi:hypothetical protein
MVLEAGALDAALLYQCMQGDFFMELFFLCVLLLVGSDSDRQTLTEQLQPVVDEYGDEQMKAAFREAQQISSMIGTVKELQAQFGGESQKNFNGENQGKNSENEAVVEQNQTGNTSKAEEDKEVFHSEENKTEVLKDDLRQGDDKSGDFTESDGEGNMGNLSNFEPIAAIASKEILVRLLKELQKN